MEMPEYRSAEFRASAAKCLRRAANAIDPKVRSSYLTIAKGWLYLANSSWNAPQLEEAILQEIIGPQTVKGGGTAHNGQQQQQSQPKKEDSRAPAPQSKIVREVWMCGTEGETVMADDAALIQGIIVIFRKCWHLSHDVADDELKDYAALLLDRIKASESETALYMEVAKIQLKLGRPRNETYREVTARAVDMVQKNSS
jgi:hypothetical protein